MSDQYAVTVDGRVRAVELEEIGERSGELRVVVDGRERVVDARPLGEGVWSILHDGQARLIQVDAGPASKLTVEVSHPDGEPRICVAEVADPRKRDAVAAAAGRGEAGPLTLRAPIPGRLAKVLVKAGDQVKAGQTLLVLEAMKMENELRAPRAGVISTLHVAEGVAVEAGQNLISIA